MLTIYDQSVFPQHGGDPSDFITVYHGNIIGMMDDDSERTIGKLIVYVVERGRVLNKGISLFDVMDCLDGESCGCFANLFDHDTEELKPEVQLVGPALALAAGGPQNPARPLQACSPG